MVLRTHPWIQNEKGLSLLLARDVNFAGPIQGVESLLSDNELHVVTTTKKFPLGTMIYDVGSDSVYRYVEFGGTTKAGDVIQAEGPDGAHDDLDPTGSGLGAGVAKGSTIISISDSITLVVNEYAGGFLVIEADTGIGYRYPIESNEVAAAVANALVVLRTPGLALAIDSTSDVKLVKSRYQEVIIAPTALTAVVVGAGLGIGADGSFGWVQTRGPAAVATDGAVVIGAHVMPSNGTAGEVEAWALTDGTPNVEIHPPVGYVMDVGATGETSLIFLTLE